jgi:uncharacterized protein YjbI with pentapeptide repeats
MINIKQSDMTGITKENLTNKLYSGQTVWNLWINELSKEIPKIKLRSDKVLKNKHVQNFEFTINEFPKIKIEERAFENYNFSSLKWSVECKNSTFTNCVFNNSNFNNSEFISCRFANCHFERTFLMHSELNYSIFTDCDFTKSNLCNSNLYFTEFIKCKIVKATLMWAKLIGSLFQQSIIYNTEIFGSAIWDIILDNSQTKDLIISKKNETQIKVDNIEIAQFIYLLLNNSKIRETITSLTSKLILILGRFTSERLKVLTDIKEHLSNKGYVPILFTFEPSVNRDITETVQLLASISKLVIADITEPRSIPQELSHIIPFYPSLPIQPIILSQETEYGMFEHWTKYPWVKPLLRYDNSYTLLKQLEEII